jgi:hypothetical protein
MVSTADIQQIIFSIIGAFDFGVIAMTEPTSRNSQFIQYLPWLEQYSSIRTRLFLAAVTLFSLFAAVIAKEFGKQDRVRL